MACARICLDGYAGLNVFLIESLTVQTYRDNIFDPM